MMMVGWMAAYLDVVMAEMMVASSAQLMAA